VVIIHELLKWNKLSTKEKALIRKLSKRKIISVVLKKGVLGVARAGTNRGKKSQLYKYVDEADL
jgi:hypothetical protein